MNILFIRLPRGAKAIIKPKMIKIIHNKKIQPFVGMKVKIRENLNPYKRYGGILFNEFMINYCSKEAKIQHYDTILKRINLDIDSCQWIWTKEMLIPLE